MNAPVILGTRAIATPLAYANTVVLKASEICPRTHGAIARALEDAGLPAGAVNLITNAPAGPADVVDELLAHPKDEAIRVANDTEYGLSASVFNNDVTPRLGRRRRQRLHAVQ